MTNLTPVYWEASGGSLHTHAWSITTKGGSRRARPPKRGDDIALPYHTGRMYSKKVRDAHTIDLPMWCNDLNPDGTVDATMSREAKLEENWNALMDLFDVDGQFPLGKRWYEGNVVKSAVGYGEMLDPPDPVVIADNVYGFTVPVFMADPYFYDPVASQAIGTINVEGNAETNHVTITMGNGRFTGADGNWIQFNGSGTVVIDIAARTAKVGATYVNGQITRNLNFQSWPTLQPGSNALTGSGTIEYEAAYT